MGGGGDWDGGAFVGRGDWDGGSIVGGHGSNLEIWIRVMRALQREWEGGESDGRCIRSR